MANLEMPLDAVVAGKCAAAAATDVGQHSCMGSE
jgi:hypothetical protein